MGAPAWVKRRTEKTKAWILAHPKASIAETMAATGSSQPTISKIRKEFITAGMMERFSHTPRNDDNPEPDKQTTSTQELLAVGEIEAILEDRAPLTPAQRRAKLEAIFLAGSEDHAIRANQQLENMDRRSGEGEQVGPPPPQTLDEAIVEAADIVEALAVWGGERAVRQAVTTGLKHFYAEQKKADPKPGSIEPDSGTEPLIVGVSDVV